MVDPLAPLLADGVIDEVVARLKSGKEADLWIVRHRGEAIAAKVYKARETRSFRNDAVYREGRQVRNTRTQRAMSKGSRFGQAASEDAWKVKEADALHALHAAGVRVPTPVMFYEGVLLMELVVGEDGHPAPRLIDAHVPRDRAAALYAELRGQVVRMLGCDLIHGDLSPYNVLLGRDGPVVIDFPQVIGAAHNSQAERFFHRDLENVRRFCAALDPALHAAAGDAREIWRAYVRRELTADFVPTGKAVEPPRGASSDARDAREPRVHGEPRRGGGGQRGQRRGDPGGRPGGGGPSPGARERGGPRAEHPRRDDGAAPSPARRPPESGPAQRSSPRRKDETRRDRGPRAPERVPEVVRVVRPPLGAPAQAPRAQPQQPPRPPQPQQPSRAHPPQPPRPQQPSRAHPPPQPPPRAHPPQQPPPRVHAPQPQHPPRAHPARPAPPPGPARTPSPPHGHPRGAEPAGAGGAPAPRRRRRRRRGPRPA